MNAQASKKALWKVKVYPGFANRIVCWVETTVFLGKGCVGMLAPEVDTTEFKSTVASGLHSAYLRFGKRTVDSLAASLLLVVFLAPVVFLGLLIVLETPGNPLFIQRRVGKKGRIFRMWKLRTMVSTPVKALVFLEDESGERVHKVRADPRVTRIGRFLRRTSLDELPQLVNVLAGQMSLVGPRPELPEIVATYEPWQHRRHEVVPGITGLWQVSGRSNLPMHENTELDIFYVEARSIELDWKIIRKTMFSVIKGVGAY